MRTRNLSSLFPPLGEGFAWPDDTGFHSVVPEDSCQSVREARFPGEVMRSSVHPDDIVADSKTAGQWETGELVERHASGTVDSGDDFLTTPFWNGEEIVHLPVGD